MVLSRPPWTVFLIIFPLNRRGNESFPTNRRWLSYNIWVKNEAQWTTFNLNTLKGIALGISSIKYAS